MKPAYQFYFRALILSFVLSPLSVPAQKASDLLGIWITPEGLGHVEIKYNRNTNFFEGEIVWLKNPVDSVGKPVKDENGNTVMHLKILKGFTYDDGEWVDGRIYDPETCKNYYCSMELATDSILEVHGSIDSFGLIGRTEIWKRVPENTIYK